jgi:MSHA biogenesis protein MshK
MKPISNKYLATVLLSLTAKAAYAERLADPTRPATARASTSGAERAETLKLEAIMSSADGTVAIVNGKVVHVGDRIGSARIEAIGTDTVRYMLEGRNHTARLQSRSIPVRRNVSSEDAT